ncbi:MAG TPA: proton-conducting transporter membrane subunit, partial [Candidatus Acidoferrum sp.]|nr:proton-conducting transporter membrane subunit [Candidatus Acidoferrum sp.]
MHFSFLDAVINYIHGDGITVLPQMELLLFALGILIFDFLLEKKEKHWNAGLALAGVAASALGLFMQAKRFNLQHEARPDLPGVPGFQNTVIIDGYSLFFAAIFLVATALVILLSVRYLDLEREQEGEYYALLLLACIGMMFMASGTDLIVMFLGLETMALSFYVLSGYLRREKRSNEAALKYLLLGGFSTGILAYGFSLLYGLTASTSLLDIGGTLDRRFQYVAGRGMADWLLILSFVTVAAGLFFKIAAVPFHQWAPDVYEGSPTPIAAYV